MSNLNCYSTNISVVSNNPFSPFSVLISVLSRGRKTEKFNYFYILNVSPFILKFRFFILLHCLLVK